MDEEVVAKLADFVKLRRSKGYNDGFIAESLLKARWEPEIIRHVLVSPQAKPLSYTLDPRVVTYIEASLRQSLAHHQIIEQLVKHGWSVAAIKAGLEKAASLLDYRVVLDNANKSTFVHKHRSHFFSRASDPKSAVDIVKAHEKSVLLGKANSGQDKAQDDEAKKLLKQIELLKEEFASKEKFLLDQEQNRREDLLSRQVQELQRALLSKQNAPQSGGEPVLSSSSSIPSPVPVVSVVSPKRSAPPLGSAPAVSSSSPASVQPVKSSETSSAGLSPSIVVMDSSASSLDVLEKKFQNLMAARGNTFEAYTNPIIPERLHLVTTPKGDRVQTGIPGLDPIIEGGIMRYSTTLVGGGPGTGKSTLCLQYLVNGVLHYDEPGVYISFEESRESICELGLQFNWDLEQLERDRKLIIKEYTPEQIDKILEAGGGSVRDLIDFIGAKRIVIDSITAFMLLYDGEIAQRRSCLRLFRSLSKWGCTTMAIAEEQGNMGQHHASVLEYEAAGVILLYNERKGDLRQRSLEIFKMRGTKHAGRIFPMRINDHGIEVYPRETF